MHGKMSNQEFLPNLLSIAYRYTWLLCQFVCGPMFISLGLGLGLALISWTLSITLTRQSVQPDVNLSMSALCVEVLGT